MPRKKRNFGWVDDGNGGRIYEPIPLPKRYIGKTLCREADDIGKVCVVGQKYGFTGQLYGRNGKSKLLVPTSDGHGEEARTPERALTNAINFMRRLKLRYN